jgi:hypothetical protein
LLVCAAASGKDDDGIMGVWEGSFTGGAWNGKSISAKIVATKAGTWKAIVTILDEGKPVASAEMEDTVPDKTISFVGKGDLGPALGGVHDVTASGGPGKLTGEFKAAKRGATPIPFAMERIEVKPPTLGQPAPDGAIVLLGGGGVDRWGLRPSTGWALHEDGSVQVSNPSFVSKQEFGSCKIHLEFRTPFMPDERVGSQARGNSGVYVQGRYEIQILDSFGAAPANNLCGGIYKIATPLADAVLPPLTWQTYDIEFHAPKFDDAGRKTQDAELTVYHNGTLIHDKLKLPHATPGGTTEDEGRTGPILLQHHNDAVSFRNIWVLPIED